MALIKSGDSNALLKVETQSLAARVLSVFSDGSPARVKPTGAYSLPLVLFPTIITTGAVIFAMQNTGSKKVKVNRINLTMNFIGTATTTRSVFEFVKFTGTAPTGGVDMPIGKRDSQDPTPSVGIARNIPAGAVLTGTSFESTALHTLSMPNQIVFNTYHDLQLDNPIVLNPNEGLAIRLNGAIVAGAGLTGGLFWYEE